MEKINIGIKVFDERFVFQKGFFSLFAGINNVGKSVFMKELFNSALTQGHKCILIDLKNQIHNTGDNGNNLNIFRDIYNIEDIEKCCENIEGLDIAIINGYENIINLEKNVPKSQTSWRLKCLAKKLNVLLIATVKLNGDMLHSKDKPSKIRLRDYGPLEIDSDQIFFANKISKCESQEIIELDCYKNRSCIFEKKDNPELFFGKENFLLSNGKIEVKESN